MSAAPARVPARGTAARRPALTLVAPARRPPRAPFVVLLLAVAGTGLVGLLVLNTVVAQKAFLLHDLDRRAAALAEQERALRGEVAAIEAPAVLAARAAGLGLVPAGDPVFLRVADGAVLGDPRPASAPPPPPPKASASPRPSTSPSVGAASTGPARSPAPTGSPRATTSPRPTTSPKPSAQPSTQPSPSPSGARR